jgi:hypothetical protein
VGPQDPVRHHRVNGGRDQIRLLRCQLLHREDIRVLRYADDRGVSASVAQVGRDDANFDPGPGAGADVPAQPNRHASDRQRGGQRDPNPVVGQQEQHHGHRRANREIGCQRSRCQHRAVHARDVPGR